MLTDSSAKAQTGIMSQNIVGGWTEEKPEPPFLKERRF